jgi:hypothetical protein
LNKGGNRIVRHVFGTAVTLLATLLIGVPFTAAAENRALLIGINDYLANDVDASQTAGQTWIPEDLNGAVNDVAIMKQTLVTRFGFDEEHIVTLFDRDATRENMLKVMREFVASTEPGDVAYIHFSGHGSQVEDVSGDEADKLDETILPYDARTGSIADITDDELQSIFGQLRSTNTLIVLDSCHSGTATRGGNALKARSTPLDPRGELYAAVKPPSQGGEQIAEYILMTGAADYQSALDGPLDNGRYYGLFTWSLAKSLGRMPAGASAQDIHEGARQEMQEIGTKFGLWSVPESQLEANDTRKALPLLTEASLEGRAVARLPYASVEPLEDGSVRLRNAATLGAGPNSLWAIYGPGETRFEPGRELTQANIVRIIGDDAIAKPDQKVSVVNARAVQLLAAPSAGKVSFRFDRMTAQMHDGLLGALRSMPKIEVVDGNTFARYVVDFSGDHFAVRGAGGIQLVDEFWTRDPNVAAQRLAVIANRTQSVDDLLELNNTASALQVRVDVNPQDAFGGVRGVKVVGASDAKAYRIRRQGEPRNRSNSLMLEIEVSDDSYITVVDIDPEGSVGMLFPNSISDRRGFYRDGLIKAGRPVSIPDALADNSAGFYWDYVAPAGIDTIRVFAARDLATARKIRQYIAELASNVNTRGNNGGMDRRDLFRAAPSMGQRGVQVVAEDSGSTSSSDWAAATTIFLVEE